MNSLSINTPILDRYTNALKKVEHEHFEIRKTLEMKHRVAVVFYENINGEFGRPMLQVIQEDLAAGTITQSVYQQSRQRFRTIFYDSDTAGTYVNAETGEAILPDDNGNYPDGMTVIPELDFWQALAHDLFPGATLSEKVYAALSTSMSNMIVRNRI